VNGLLIQFVGRPRRSLDMQKTQMQETGGFEARGLTLSEILEVVNDLGLDLNKVALADTAVWVLP
jgi:hypothetical protein